MKKTSVIFMLAVLASGVAYGAGAGGSGSAPSAAAGLIRFEPPQPLGCVAVRVDVPGDKMLTGLRWRNGTAALAFPKILVASGTDLTPPPYSEAVMVAEQVQGLEQDWSSVEFTTSVASESGTLFLILEYPSNYAPASSGPELGVGWVEGESSFTHFVSGDGETWIKVAGRCRVLVEPVLEDRTPGVVSLRGPADPALPEVVEQHGLFVAPNPFNPEARIDLYLAAASTGDVRIIDIQGRQVAELHRGALAMGRNSFVWSGTDYSGRVVASGVYWVLAQTADERHVKKLLLVK